MNALDTPVTRLLQAAGVPFRLLPHTAPVFTVDEAAAQRGVRKEEMVKSILLRESKGQKRYVMACVLGDDRLDPKAVRDHLPDDWKRLTFASAEEIAGVTGYTKGAVAPLGMPDDVPVFFDQAIQDCTRVNISSGDHMAGLELDPDALIALTGATLAPITDPASPA